MTAAAKLIIVGQSHDELINQLLAIKAWQNGKDHDIHVHISDDVFIRDKVENIENAINTDIQDYIAKHFSKRYSTKSDGNSIIQLIDNPDCFNDEGRYKSPHRKHASNYTPPKKRRK